MRELRKRRSASEDSVDMPEPRIPTERVQKYAAVRANDDNVLDDDDLGDNSNHVSPSDEDEVSSDDGGELGRLNVNKKRRPRRRLRAPPPMNHQGGSIVLGNAKILLVMCFVVLAAVLIMWHSTKAAKKKHPLAKGDADLDGDDDNVFDDDDDESLMAKTLKAGGKYNVTYDLSWMESSWNPFNLQVDGGDEYDETEPWTPPTMT